LAFAALGNKGRIVLAEEHSCTECTKPYKTGIGAHTIDPNAEPVQMVVVDGIVVGPVVSLMC